MVLFRHKRTVLWALLLGGGAAALFVIPMEDRASGPFQVRPAVRAEVRARVAGFLQTVCCDEGDRVSPGTVVARLEVPDLASRIAQKTSEVREVQARLRLLEIGPRYEELIEQGHRVERAEAWRDLARQDLARARQALAEDLKRLEEQIVQHRAELAAAQDALARVERLRSLHSSSTDELVEMDKRRKVSRAQLEQAQAQKKSRQALGTQESEAELARREKELAEAQGTLRLLEAGTRPEEIEAERARLARLQDEARYLEGVQARLPVSSPVAGLIATPRLQEKVGQFVHEGDLICLVEEPALLEAEVVVAEQDAAHLQVGQQIALKARALPFTTFTAQVERIAPTAGHGDVQSSVTVYCRLENEGADLRPGMTGHARVFTGRHSVGRVLLERGLRFLRTEFWW
jgi:multidrug efflux pump subunit AcrA (membrane-fusion protein)